MPETQRRPLPPTHTYQELVEAWGRVANLAKSTEKTYACYLLKYLLPAFGKRDPATITVQEIDTFYATLRATNLAPRTIRQVHAIFRRSMAVGVKWGWLPFNPVAMTGPEVRVQANEVEAPTPDEVRLLMEGCERYFGQINPGHGLMLRLFVMTGAYLGTRRGETCGLRWEDIDWAVPSIQVRRSVTSEGNVKDTKTGAIGTLVIPKQLSTVLWDLCVQQQVWDEASQTWRGWVFHDRGQVWLPDTVTAQVLAVRDKLGLPKRCCLKNLRHFNATQLLAQGNDIGTVAARLRHADKSTTMRFYSKRDEAADQRAAASLEGLL